MLLFEKVCKEAVSVGRLLTRVVSWGSSLLIADLIVIMGKPALCIDY